MYVPPEKLKEPEKKSPGNKSTDSATSSDDGWVFMDQFPPLGYTSETPRTGTKKEQRPELEKRLSAVGFEALIPYPNEIVQFADRNQYGKLINGWANSNCHGYTFSGKIGESWDGLYFLDRYKAMKPMPKVAVFVRNDEIAHSGMWDGSKLTHLLIGVGVLKTPLSPTDTIGYTGRFNLPDDLGTLEALVAPRIEFTVLNRSMRSEMGKALEAGIFTTDELKFLAGGSVDIYNAMHNKIDDLLDSYEEEDDDDEIDPRITAYLKKKDEEPGRTLLEIYHRVMNEHPDISVPMEEDFDQDESDM